MTGSPISQEIPKHQIGFLHLFYDILFAPASAANKIQTLQQYDSARLFAYAAAILGLSTLASIAYQQGGAISFVVNLCVWFVSVLVLALVAWLFRSKEAPFDFASLFYFCACAQAPLSFLGIAFLWENASLLSLILFAFPFHIWSMCLFCWALVHALKIETAKAILILLLSLVAPLAGTIIFFSGLIYQLVS